MMKNTKHLGMSKAFLKLYNDTHEDLKKYILKLTSGNKYLSEEVIQNTYLCAKENQEKLFEHPNPAGWLFVTAKNLYYKQIKLVSDYYSHEIELTDDLAKIETDFLSCDEDKYDELLKNIKASLTEKESRLFNEYFIQNIPLKTIAENMKENYVNIRKYNSRLKIKLMNIIKNKK